MKIAGTVTGSPDGIANHEALSKPEAPGAGKESGKAFAERTEISKPAEGVGGTTASATTAAGVPGVQDLGSALEAGKLSATDAVNQVVNRILDAQVGPTASPDVRQKVEAALREALQTDPVLVAQITRLER